MTIASGDCPCQDCGWDTTEGEEFIVRDELWQSVAINAHGGFDRWLCVGCLERRLGRLLTPADFEDVPLHDDTGPQSPRLLSRLGRTA